jgi:hypothetical protein
VQRIAAGSVASPSLAGFGGTSAHRDALNALVIVAIFLVVLSLRNSWDLLVSVGAAVAQRQ